MILPKHSIANIFSATCVSFNYFLRVGAIERLRVGIAVGFRVVGNAVGRSVGFGLVGSAVAIVGKIEGLVEGVVEEGVAIVGKKEGDADDGTCDGIALRDIDGIYEGKETEGLRVGVID
jgi:hypothetical protein